MAEGNFEPCSRFTFGAEGGYSDDPRDSGNWCNGLLVGSNRGITPADVRAVCGWRFSITREFMQALTLSFASRVLRSQYWNAVRGDALWVGLDLMGLDFGFNAGTGTFALEFQQILRVEADGIIGPQTLAAAQAVSDREAFLGDLTQAELAHYRGLSTWPVYGNGWTSRAEARLALATQMMKGGPSC